MKSLVCQSQSEGITRALGNKLASQLTTGGVILLHGELGTGKTTFVQGMADGLAIQHSITSPTFTILNTYPAEHPVIKQLAHVDLYRINSEEQIVTIDLPHYMNDPSTLLVIEWAERLPWKWPNLLGDIFFSSAEMHHHTITVEGEISQLLR